MMRAVVFLCALSAVAAAPTWTSQLAAAQELTKAEWDREPVKPRSMMLSETHHTIENCNCYDCFDEFEYQRHILHSAQSCGLKCEQDDRCTFALYDSNFIGVGETRESGPKCWFYNGLRNYTQSDSHSKYTCIAMITPSPTQHPTRTPTPSPTQYPTLVPTPSPTPSPTEVPTPSPTPTPTEHPTTRPPSPSPSHTPTEHPTQVPSPSPTAPPTQVPTPSPTATPTTAVPTSSPAVFSDSTQFSLSQSNAKTSMTTLQEYTLQFDIYPQGTVNGWNNIMHMSGTGANCCNVDSSGNADRTPAIWFYSDTTRMHIRQAHMSNGNAGCDPSASLTVNSWTTVRVDLVGSTLTVYYNGVSQCTDTSFSSKVPAQAVSNYWSDPWYSASNAQIRNIYYGVPL